MKFRTLNDFNFKGKRVLVRSDLNSPSVNGKFLDNPRISESAVTLKELKRKGAKVVVLAHQARKGEKDFLSLSQHAKLLNKYVKVEFVEGIISDKAIHEIKSLKNGEILLLDNVRFLKEEFDPSLNNNFVKRLSPLFDYYVNDAFSVSHRAQTSIVSFPKVLKSCVGRLMEKELNNLEKVKTGNCLFVLGGIKMEEIIELTNRKNRILAGGLFGPLCLISQAYDLGKTNEILNKDFVYLRKLKKNVRRNFVLPVDFAVDNNGKRENLKLEEFPSKYRILDIGEETIKIFVSEIKKARNIFVKGPMGLYTEKSFDVGTREILRAIGNSKAFSVVAGGHTADAISEMKISKNRFGYVSLAGGALVEYIAGKKLVGLEALESGVKK